MGVSYDLADHDALAAYAVHQAGACQNGWELSRLIDVLVTDSPLRTVVEIGSDRGGTLWLWQQLGADVCAVTLHTRSDGIFNAHGAHVIEADSTASDTESRVREWLGRRTADVVFIDAAHDAPHVWRDYHMATRLAPNGLIVLHDIAGHMYQPGCEVEQVWNAACYDRPAVAIVAELGHTPGVGIIYPQLER